MPRPGAKALQHSPRRQRHVIGSIAFRHPHGPRDHVGLQPAIGIREENPVARGRAGADVAGVTFAEPAFRQHVHALHLHPRVLLRQPPQDLAGSVGGPIIHDDEFSVHPALREQMMNRLLNPRFLIARRDDHGTSNRSLGSADAERSGRSSVFQRRQAPHPAQVPQRGECHGQEQRGRPAEDKSRPHCLIAVDHDCFPEICNARASHSRPSLRYRYRPRASARSLAWKISCHR